MKAIISLLVVGMLASCSASKQTLYIQPGTIEIKDGKLSLVPSGPKVILQDTTLHNSFLITKKH